MQEEVDIRGKSKTESELRLISRDTILDGVMESGRNNDSRNKN